MKIGKNGVENEMNVSLNNNKMDKVDTNYSGINEEVNHRIEEAQKACRALKCLRKERHISIEVSVGMYEGIIEPSLLYGCEA